MCSSNEGSQYLARINKINQSDRRGTQRVDWTLFFTLFVSRVRKILNLRLFEDENGRAWSKSVMERDFEVLCVSQFTLQCILKGNKPDFHSAMPAELAQPFYNSILESMRSAYKPEHIKGGWTNHLAVLSSECCSGVFLLLLDLRGQLNKKNVFPFLNLLLTIFDVADRHCLFLWRWWILWN